MMMIIVVVVVVVVAFVRLSSIVCLLLLLLFYVYFDALSFYLFVWYVWLFECARTFMFMCEWVFLGLFSHNIAFSFILHTEIARLKLRCFGIHICVYMFSTHMCIYIYCNGNALDVPLRRSPRTTAHQPTNTCYTQTHTHAYTHICEWLFIASISHRFRVLFSIFYHHWLAHFFPLTLEC